MIKPFVALVTLTVAISAASPAFALFCNGGTSEVTVGFEFEAGNSEGFLSQDNPTEFELMRLRRAGIDAESVEYWNGCLRAFTPDGMRFFDPETLEEVY